MGRQAGHNAQDGGLRHYRELPVGQHPGVYPADGAEAEKALLDAGDHEADLVQMGVQQQLLRARSAAQAHADGIAEAVYRRLIHIGTHQLHGLLGHRPLKAGGARQGT